MNDSMRDRDSVVSDVLEGAFSEHSYHDEPNQLCPLCTRDERERRARLILWAYNQGIVDGRNRKPVF